MTLATATNQLTTSIHFVRHLLTQLSFSIKDMQSEMNIAGDVSLNSGQKQPLFTVADGGIGHAKKIYPAKGWDNIHTAFSSLKVMEWIQQSEFAQEFAQGLPEAHHAHRMLEVSSEALIMHYLALKRMKRTPSAIFFSTNGSLEEISFIKFDCALSKMTPLQLQTAYNTVVDQVQSSNELIITPKHFFESKGIVVRQNLHVN